MVRHPGSLLRSALRGAAGLLIAAIALAAGSGVHAQSRIKVLLVTGQSNR